MFCVDRYGAVSKGVMKLPTWAISLANMSAVITSRVHAVVDEIDFTECDPILLYSQFVESLIVKALRVTQKIVDIP